MKKSLSVLLIIIMCLSCVLNVCALPSNWAASEVSKAIKMGVVPEKLQDDYQNAITREEFCEMVVHAYEAVSATTLEVGENIFADTQNPSVVKAYYAGIVKGTGENTFAPSAFITRQEICTMLARFIEKTGYGTILSSYPNTFPDISEISDWALTSVQFMNINEIMLGDENGNINPHGNTTREQSILLMYRLINRVGKDTDSQFADMLISSSGNTQCNFKNGSFAIVRDGSIYVSDGKSVRKIQNGISETLLSEGADGIMALSDGVYFIKSEDSLIYKIDNKTSDIIRISDKKASEMSVIDNKIYFVSDDGVYYVSQGGKDITIDNDKATECPVTAGKAVYYTDNKAIYAADMSNKIYDGINKNLTARNDNIYFIDGDGYLTSLNVSGNIVSRISPVPVKEYCTMADEIIVLTTNKEVYKLGYDGKYFIKTEFDNYEHINTYKNDVFGKSADGKVIKFSTDASQKEIL